MIINRQVAITSPQPSPPAAADRERAARDRNDATQEIQAAHLDDLTGVYRRGMGEAILNHELLRSARAGTPLTVSATFHCWT